LSWSVLIEINMICHPLMRLIQNLLNAINYPGKPVLDIWEPKLSAIRDTRQIWWLAVKRWTQFNFCRCVIYPNLSRKGEI
jgi:hypothetical protein